LATLLKASTVFCGFHCVSSATSLNFAGPDLFRCRPRPRRAQHPLADLGAAAGEPGEDADRVLLRACRRGDAGAQPPARRSLLQLHERY